MLTSLISSAEGVCCEWKRSDQPRNKSVKRGDRLVSIKTLTETIHVTSPCSGNIKSILIKEGCNVINGDVMAYIEHCKHPALFNSLCVSCGEKVAVISSSQTEQGNTMVNGTSISHQNKASNAHSSSLLFAGGQRLLLSKDEALRVQQSKSLGLQSVRKLALVLDLDHTLVHATGAWPGYAATLGSLLGNSSSDIKRIYIEEGPGMPPKCYLVKQRPQLEAFLKEAHTLFQMTIYTAGTRRYAEAVAKLMDPLGIYFAGRIVSRSDIPNDKSDGLDKSLQRIFLKDASMVVVMDDREDVWKGDQVEQLLLVKPFHYFTGCEEVNNVAGSPAAPLGPVILLAGERPGSLLDPNTIPKSFVSPSAAKSVNSQNDHDDQLPRCLTLLRKIHKKFFLANAISLSAPTFTSQPEGSTVAKIINEMKLTILAGCSIAFSGVIPVKLPVEQHHFWRLAESLGARVQSEVTSETTHLLSVSVQSQGQGPHHSLTSKAKECLGRGDVWVIHPDWLFYCRYSLAKAMESTFMLVAQPPGRALPNPHIQVRRTAPSSSSSLRLDPGLEGSSGSDHSQSKRDKGVRIRLREGEEESSNNEEEEYQAPSKRIRIGEIATEEDRTVIDRIMEIRQDSYDNGNEYDDDQDEENYQFGINGGEGDQEGGEEGNGSFSNYNDGNNDNDDEGEDDSDEGSLDDFDSIILQR